MEKEDTQFLIQLVNSLEDAEEKLEEANEKKDYEGFRKTKKLMMNIQRQISEILR